MGLDKEIKSSAPRRKLLSYLETIDSLESPKHRELARISYDKKFLKLDEFSQGVEKLFKRFDFVNIVDKKDLLGFIGEINDLHKSVDVGDAEVNFVKIFHDSSVKNEDFWRIRKELYQDKYLSLGLFLHYRQVEFKDYLNDRSHFARENASQYETFKDDEQLILSSWGIGGEFVQDFLRTKANVKDRLSLGKEYVCPNTRKVLVTNNLISRE